MKVGSARTLIPHRVNEGALSISSRLKQHLTSVGNTASVKSSEGPATDAPQKKSVQFAPTATLRDVNGNDTTVDAKLPPIGQEPRSSRSSSLKGSLRPLEQNQKTGAAPGSGEPRLRSPEGVGYSAWVAKDNAFIY
jgi:hypothetical protein